MGSVQNSIANAARRSTVRFLRRCSNAGLRTTLRTPRTEPTVSDLGRNQFRVQWSEPFVLDRVPLQVTAVVTRQLFGTRVTVIAQSEWGRVTSRNDLARCVEVRDARRQMLAERHAHR